VPCASASGGESQSIAIRCRGRHSGAHTTPPLQEGKAFIPSFVNGCAGVRHRALQ
jgi:hypothetical protein